MYLEFYKLQDEPFRITPDPEFFYLSASHREAFASLVYGANERKGFVVLTGEVGTGKTTVLRAFLKEAEGSGIHPIYLFDPDISFSALVRVLLREMGVTPDVAAAGSWLEQLQIRLIDEFAQNRNVVLLIDEAQNMPVETLEKLRMLSNLETEREKLLQIVLVGQPELDRKLALHELRQLKQRVAVRTAIRALTENESVEYIQHRLDRAGAQGRVFSRGAMRRIVRHARGIPRTLNVLCDNALIAGYGSQRRPVPARVVASVISELEGRKRARSGRWVAAATVAAVVGGLCFSAGVGIQAGLRDVAEVTPVKSVAGNAAPLEGVILDEPEAPVVAVTVAPDASEAAPDSTVAVAAEAPEAVTPREAPHNEMAVDAAAAESTPVQEPVVAPPESPVVEEPAEQEPVPVTRVAQPGDCLTKLITDVYGFCDAGLLERVRQENPRIEDIDTILVGEVIVFPPDGEVGVNKPEFGKADLSVREMSQS